MPAKDTGGAEVALPGLRRWGYTSVLPLVGQPGNGTARASAVGLEVLPDPGRGERPGWLAALVDDYAV